MTLYALLPEEVALERADEWAEDMAVTELASYVEETVVDVGHLDPETTVDHIHDAADPAAQVYAYLAGIDVALRLVHPRSDSSDRGPLDAIAVRYSRTGRLNSDPSDGALLPRFSFPERFRALEDDVAIEEKADLFESVIVAAPELWREVDHVRIPRAVSPPASIHRDGVRIGCAPLCDGADVALSCTNGRPRRRYSATIRGAAPAGRLDAIVGQLDRTGAHIAVMPELTLDAELLDRWRATLAASIPSAGSRLRLLLIGTGAFERRADGRYANRGVLLDRAGNILLAQDKRHPFALDAATVEQWGLAPELGAGAAAEPLIPGARLQVAEGPFGRLVVLVCEDLGRTVRDGALLYAIGPSLCLAPVFSKPTLAHYWEHSRAKAITAEIGASVVIANSQVVEDRQRAAGIPPGGEGTALAHGPAGYETAYATDPGEVVVLRLHPDEVVRLA